MISKTNGPTFFSVHMLLTLAYTIYIFYSENLKHPEFTSQCFFMCTHFFFLTTFLKEEGKDKKFKKEERKEWGKTNTGI